jgi:hypothetical protein
VTTTVAYGIPVDDRLAERLAEVWLQQGESWTAMEFGGTSTHPTIAAMCALRADEVVRRAPLSGLVGHPGIQGPLLAALDPMAVGRLGAPSKPLRVGLLERIGWPVGSAELSRT